MAWIISLIIALVLVLPTFGLSLIFWLVAFVLSFRAKKRAMDLRHQNRAALDLYVKDPGSLIQELHLPRWRKMAAQDASRGGALILNYIANNTSEMDIFLDGVHRATATMMYASSKDAVTATVIEMSDGHLEKQIHLVCFRAIEALVANNDLDCFNDVNLKVLKRYISEIERRGKFTIDKEFSVF